VVVKTDFVKKHATCPVIVSGRNNFVYVNKEADLDKALSSSMAKRQIFRFVPDKVLIDTNLENWEAFLSSN
jgi:glutamate-5-semialdehyde dehydrogenase